MANMNCFCNLDDWQIFFKGIINDFSVFLKEKDRCLNLVVLVYKESTSKENNSLY